VLHAVQEFIGSVTSSNDVIVVAGATMQQSEFGAWSAAHQLINGAQTHWRHVMMSFGQPSVLDARTCFHLQRQQPRVMSSTSYVEQASREWMTNCVSYYRLKQLESSSNFKVIDAAAQNVMATVGSEETACFGGGGYRVFEHDRQSASASSFKDHRSAGAFAIDYMQGFTEWR